MLVAVLVLFPVLAKAEDVFVGREQIIATRCQEVIGLLDQLQRRDLVSRTNLGREHETIARMLSAFNQRLEHNHLDALPYIRFLAEINSITTQFREAYVRYDDSMNELRTIDCRTKPAEFDAKLAHTRQARDATEGAVTHAAAVISQYRDMLAQMRASLPERPPEQP